MGLKAEARKVQARGEPTSRLSVRKRARIHLGPRAQQQQQQGDSGQTDESLAQWLGRAIMSIFKPAESSETSPDFTHTGTGFSGDILSPSDIHRLQRVEQVIQEVKERTPEKKPEQAPPDETVGHFLSEAATYAFQKPEVSSDEVEEIFKSTGMGYSGEPLTDEQRRKLQRVEQVVASVREEVEKTIDESEQQ